ncbi:CDP-alcohol phosphatidyltransferase family protein [Acidothermaceae bacterium B102]|nr:CDP-alcohol phosphatidyltransferase family protein [Acidothermaceae bacterium B102]
MEDSPAVSDAIWTIPNLLSALRVAGVPVFLWLVLGPHADGWAVILLMFSGASDYFDGKLARAWNQTSRLGQLLDPAADRLYIVATVVALAIRDVIPVWLVVVLIGRDVVLACTLPVLRRHGYGPLPVHYLGKAATFNLLYAFPLILLGAGHGWGSPAARTVGWAFTVWGVGLYWWAGLLYLAQVRDLTSAKLRRLSGTGAASA